MIHETGTIPAMPANRSELRALIIKLRWIGQEEEAEGLACRLSDAAPQEAAILWARETD
jgi:hypothetical protein